MPFSMRFRLRFTGDFVTAKVTKAGPVVVALNA